MHFWLQILIGDLRTKIYSRNILVAYIDVVTVIVDFGIVGFVKQQKLLLYIHMTIYLRLK